MIIKSTLPGWLQPPSVTQWSDACTPPFEIPWLGFMNNCIHPDTVLTVGRFLLPNFVEYEGGVFLEHKFSEKSFREWMRELNDMAQVENLLNHQHIYDLFIGAEDVSEESFYSAAVMLSQTLSLALGRCFPEREFQVTLSNSDLDYGPVVSFFSVAGN